jgi:hypothetical protein
MTTGVVGEGYAAFGWPSPGLSEITSAFQAGARTGLPGAPAITEAYRGEHPVLFFGAWSYAVWAIMRAADRMRRWRLNATMSEATLPISRNVKEWKRADKPTSVAATAIQI